MSLTKQIAEFLELKSANAHKGLGFLESTNSNPNLAKQLKRQRVPDLRQIRIALHKWLSVQSGAPDVAKNRSAGFNVLKLQPSPAKQKKNIHGGATITGGCKGCGKR